MYEKGGDFVFTTIGERKIKKIKVRGGKTKTKLQSDKYANVFYENTGKGVKSLILGVAENSANRLFTRRNIISKGAIIKVKTSNEEFYARVLSRPGQSGMINAVRLPEYLPEKELKIKSKKEKKEELKNKKESTPKKVKKTGKKQLKNSEKTPKNSKK